MRSIAMQAPGDRPTAVAAVPWTGILERVNMGGALVWVLALPITLLRAWTRAAPNRPVDAVAIAGHSHSYLRVR